MASATAFIIFSSCRAKLEDVSENYSEPSSLSNHNNTKYKLTENKKETIVRKK